MSQAFLAKVLIEIAVATPVRFKRESYGEPAHRLASQVGDLRAGIKHHLRTRLPQAAAEIRFLEVVKKALVEAAQSLEQFTPDQNAAPGLKSYRPFGFACPPRIGVGLENSR